MASGYALQSPREVEEECYRVRAHGVVHDEDIFTDCLLLPNGQGQPGPGTIGSDRDSRQR